MSTPTRSAVPDLPDPLPIAVVDNHTHLDIEREGVSVDVADLIAGIADGTVTIG